MTRVQQTANQIAEMAAAAFATHTVTQMLDSGCRGWRCHRPGTWIYGFDVLELLGVLLIRGDIGTLLLAGVDLAWARKNINDPHYVLGKAVPEMPCYAWSEDAALDWLDEQLRLAREEFAASASAFRLQRAGKDIKKLRAEVGSEHLFFAAWQLSSIVDSLSPPLILAPTPSALWCVEALRWFLARTEGK